MLKRFIPFAHAQSIFEIDLSFYKKLGIKYVFVDLDNTLDSYKQATPLAKAKELKENLEKNGIELIIVSNNTGKRVTKYSSELGVQRHRSGSVSATCFRPRRLSQAKKLDMRREWRFSPAWYIHI